MSIKELIILLPLLFWCQGYVCQEANLEFQVNTTVDRVALDTIKVLVVQCSNGYEYAIHGVNFNPTIESELNNYKNIRVIPFPFKKLMGVPYQGVYDKKYCQPIIDKVNVDYLILTRFSDDTDITQKTWGYQVKIVKTKTMDQVNSITAINLKSYDLVEEHIRNNIGILKRDIEKLE